MIKVRAALLAFIALLSCLVSCGDGQSSALQQLSKAGYSLSVEEFHRAASSGDAVALELFLEAGTSIDVPGENKSTALILAAAAGKIEAVSALLRHGAKVAARDASGRGMAMAAVTGAEVRVLELLQEAGLDLEAKDELLVLAAKSGHLNMTQALLPKCSEQIQAALVAAASAGSLEVAEALLNAGASLFSTTQEGLTPLALAVTGGHLSMAEFLLHSGSHRCALGADLKTPIERATAPELRALLESSPSAEELAPAGVSLANLKAALGPADLDTSVVDRLRLRCVREQTLPFMLKGNEAAPLAFYLAKAGARPIIPEVGTPLDDTGWVVHSELSKDSHLPEWMMGSWIIKNRKTFHQVIQQSFINKVAEVNKKKVKANDFIVNKLQTHTRDSKVRRLSKK